MSGKFEIKCPFCKKDMGTKNGVKHNCKGMKEYRGRANFKATDKYLHKKWGIK